MTEVVQFMHGRQDLNYRYTMDCPRYKVMCMQDVHASRNQPPAPDSRMRNPTPDRLVKQVGRVGFSGDGRLTSPAKHLHVLEVDRVSQARGTATSEQAPVHCAGSQAAGRKDSSWQGETGYVVYPPKGCDITVLFRACL